MYLEKLFHLALPIHSVLKLKQLQCLFVILLTSGVGSINKYQLISNWVKRCLFIILSIGSMIKTNDRSRHCRCILYLAFARDNTFPKIMFPTCSNNIAVINVILVRTTECI